MLQELPSLAQLIKALQQVPYLASKNLYRVVSHFLEMDQAKMEQFCAVLLASKERLTQCPTCFCWQEKKQSCLYCSSEKRNHHLICVVERWFDVLAIEKTRGFNGVYHVLNGVICPLEGIGPDDLTIKPLVERVEKAEVHEIILATNQTPEGEATAAYIANHLQDIDVKISCLARGLPVGSMLGSMDRLTVFKALSERREF